MWANMRIIGASLSEPLLVASTAALSIYIYVYMMVHTSFRKFSTSRFMRMTLFQFHGRKCPMYPFMRRTQTFLIDQSTTRMRARCTAPSDQDLDLHMYIRVSWMRNREEKLGLVVEESVNGGIMLWKVPKKEKHGWRGGE